MQSPRIFIWFFIGVLPIIYGVMMVGSGIVEWVTGNYPAGVQLTRLHAPVWWGATLLALGIVYAVKFPPRRTGKQDAAPARRMRHGLLEPFFKQK